MITMAMSITQARGMARRYRALARVVNDSDLPVSVRVPAEDEFDKLHALRFAVLVPCAVCKEHFPFTDVTLQRVVEWEDDPRGMCGRH